ncbi:hypothetical protein B4U80_02642 [Leptotrombidium deliense]|uniref:Uncharacterized protein n=1 Tax=Leptotrombidium deliense TaxID=299467 RepID=A0A443S913_9ACAR|nr:hypothetical protein B4U80_02642 [Leptotrombidium deliense]
MIDLTEVNMKQMYEKSEWGWNKDEKEAEFRHKKACFVFVTDTENGQTIGFTHFRFVFDDEGYFPVIYCYELQIQEQYYRQGIGRHLMDVLYAIGSQFKMKKVVLTTFKHNKRGMDFYMKGLGFKIDRWSPSKFKSDVSYEILSLSIKRKAHNGFTGYNCQTNYNECRLENCQNNSTCIDAIAEAQCVCLPGFSGKHCEIEINECLSNPCVHGKCIDKIDRYECKCDYGYSGVNCEIDETVCNETMANITTRCLNGGVCIEEAGFNFSCLCQNGYTGKYCENIIDNCKPNPCLNAGLCRSHIGDYNCICAFGWTGKRCEVRLRLCSENTCLNKGLCLTTANENEFKNRICYCVPGFYGHTCERRYNECIPSNKCLNGGNCVSGVDNYTCSCKESFRGVYCEVDCRTSSSEICIDAATITTIIAPSQTFIQSSFDTYSCSNDFCFATTPHETTPIVSMTQIPTFTATPSPVVSDFIPSSTVVFGNETDSKPKIPDKVYAPKFNGVTSYLTIVKDIYDSTDELLVKFSFKTEKSDSYLLYSDNQFSSGDFFVLYLQANTLKLALSCHRKMILVESHSQIADGNVHSVYIRLSLSADRKTCKVELKVNESKTLVDSGSFKAPITGLCFKHLHFGREPNRIVYSPFNGCLFDIFINGKQEFITQQISQQDLTECIEIGNICEREPCKNSGACIELINEWFCSCVVGFKGHFCEEASCELNPCRNEGFCVLQNSTSLRCICQRGYFGEVCEFALNVSHPAFGSRGDNVSYLSYSMSHFTSGEHLELRLRLITENIKQKSAIIAFMGQDNQYTPELSDDYLSISLHKGYLVYRINLGFGTKILTTALKANNTIETVYFGHHRQFVWLVTKDDVQYASRVPRKYRALNVSPDLYIGGHKNISQHLALTNHRSFKGCVFNVEARFDPRTQFERLDYVIDSRNVDECRELRLCKRSLQLCT